MFHLEDDTAAAMHPGLCPHSSHCLHQLKRNSSKFHTVSARSENAKFHLLILRMCVSLFFFYNGFPMCMPRWAYDAIIHSHSQVFKIPCALTVKPPAPLFCLVIEFYPTVYKTRNINQRLRHQPTVTDESISKLENPKTHSSADPGWLWGANSTVAWNSLSTGTVVFYIFRYALVNFPSRVNIRRIAWVVYLPSIDPFTVFLVHSACIVTMHIHDLYSCLTYDL